MSRNITGLEVNASDNIGNKELVYKGVKRAFDIISAVSMMGIGCPLYAVISALIKTEDAGPLIFVHDRLGLNGRKIKVYKFRSMQTGAEDIEAVLRDEEIEEYYREYKLKDDPRVTNIGRRLRNSYMDELPQLLNILRGDMSMVGPRPITGEELGMYMKEETKVLLSVRPGLTGYWQVYGRDNANYQNGERQKMELFYAENASLSLDVKILLNTPGAVLRKITGKR